jgi:CheY-like chemotaxis protein
VAETQLQQPNAVPLKRRVLLVDDYPDAADMLAEFLSAEGHDVAVANDGPSALKLAGELAPEVAILDLGLPQMDGCELARKLRELCGTRIQLIAVTGYSDAVTRAEAERAGIAHFLVKPLDLRILATIVSDDV